MVSSSESGRYFLVLAISLATVFVSAPRGKVQAADHPIPGAKLVLSRSSSGKEKAIFSAKGPAIRLPEPGTAGDPTTGGATIEFIEIPSLEVPGGTLPYPARWSPLGTGYAFANRRAPYVLSGVRSFVLKNGRKIKLSSRSLPLALDGDAEGLSIRITLGQTRLCARFDADTVKRSESGRFIASRARTDELSDCSDGALGVPAAPGVPEPGTIPIDTPQSDDCITDPRAGLQTLQCAGLSFELNVPDKCLEKACGLIIDVHGYGMSGPLEAIHTELREIAGEKGFIVVHPTAPLVGGSRSWSASNDSQVLAILESTREVFHVMDERIHMTGYSQGGFMTWRFLCNQPQVFGSLAPLAGSSSQCLTGERPDILYGHGTTDGLVPFAGALATRNRVISAWDLQESEVVAQDAEHAWTRYENQSGTTFEFLEFDWETTFTFGGIPLGAHCFPGSAQFLGCGADTPVHWGEAVTEFFLTHPRVEE